MLVELHATSINLKITAPGHAKIAILLAQHVMVLCLQIVPVVLYQEHIILVQKNAFLHAQ